jgi:autotransporter-associated beta strand protein
MGISRACALAAACALAGASGALLAGPTVQLGNYVASNQAGSTVVFSALVSDPAGIADDVEGMNFAIQLGNGIGLTPVIAVTLPDAFTTNTIWTSSVNSDGVFGLSTSDALFKAYGIITNNPGVAIDPNGVLARISVNTTGAATGQMAVKLTGTKDPTVGSNFFDGLGNKISATFIDGSLTIISNPVVYWNGTADAAWDTASNWSGSAKPTIAQDVYLGKPIPGTGSTLTLTSVPETVNNLWFDGSYIFSGGKLNLAGGGVTVFTGSAATINSSISGSGGLKLSGGGNLELGGSVSNTFTGNTTVSAGTLTLNMTGGAVAIPGGTVAVNGANLQFSGANQTGNQTAIVLTNSTNAAAMTLAAGANQTIGSLAGDGDVNFSATPGASLSVGSNGTPTAFSGNFNGAGTLIKTGAGTFTISGTNNSLPAVQVNGGALTFSTSVANLNGTSLGGSWTVNAGTLNFPVGSTVTTIAPGASVTLGAPTASFPALNGLTTNQGTFVISGGKTFTTAGALTNDSIVGVSGTGSALTIAGNLANSGTPGATGGTSVGPGATLIANSITQNNLVMAGNVTIPTKANGGGQSFVNNLLLLGTTDHWTGKLDLNDNSMLINYGSGSPADTIANQLKQGFGPTGHWEGTAGITSSAAAADFRHFALGWADSTNGAGSNQILIKYVRAGDANMDGIVDVVDLGILSTNYGRAATWAKGDFSYDGTVDVVDLGILSTNYGFGLSLTASQSQALLQHDLALFPEFQSVPEPAALGMLAVGSILLFQRNKKINLRKP